MAESGTDRERSKVSRVLGYATTGTTVVLTALFIQKSDGNTAVGTVLLLGAAAIGAFLVAAAFASRFFRADPQPHKLSWYLSKPALSTAGGLVGVALIVCSMVQIDREDSDYDQPPARQLVQPQVVSDSAKARGVTEISIDGDAIKLRNLVVSSNDRVVRVVVSVVNSSKAPVVLNRVLFTNAESKNDSGTSHCGNGDQRYSVEGVVHVDGKGNLRAELRAEEGPLAGLAVPAAGYFVKSCQSQSGMSMRFPISMSLNPLEASSLSVDFRRDVRVVRDASLGSTEKDLNSIFYVNQPPWFTEVSVGYESDEPGSTASVCLPGEDPRSSRSRYEPNGPCFFRR